MFAWTAAATLALAVHGMPFHAQEDDEPDIEVSVREEGGTYHVRAEFAVPQSGSAAVSVLTDYERIPSFMPAVQVSRVLHRTPDRALVEQEVVARAMRIFSRRLHLLLEINEGQRAIHFRDVAGKSFERYEGAWLVSPQNEETAILYELSAKPAFDVPAFLLKRVLERDARLMIEGLKAAIAERS